MNNNLFKAILAMDSYNRGYGEGIKVADPVEVGVTKIGSATIIQQSEIDAGEPSVEASFYAIAYSLNGEKVIAYRGTDDQVKDVLYGWPLGAINYDVPQAKMAMDFYDTVLAADNGVAQITFTGHSLGGGLAGFVGSLRNGSAQVFDSLNYKSSASALYVDATKVITPQDFIDPETQQVNQAAYEAALASQQSLIDDFYDGQAPSSGPNNGIVHAYHLEGEVLNALTFTRLEPSSPYSLAPNVNLDGVERHDIATLAIRMFADTPDNTGNPVSFQWWDSSAFMFSSLYSESIAVLAGAGDIQGTLNDDTGDREYAQIMRQALAYSAIDEGTRVFGDTGIRAMYADAVELGKSNLTQLPTQWAQSISDAMVQFAGQMAIKQVTQSANPEAKEGILDLHGAVGGMGGGQENILDIDFSDTLWALGRSSEGAPSVILGRTALVNDILGPRNPDDIGRIAIVTNNNSVVTTTLETDTGKYALFVSNAGADTITGTVGNDIILGMAGQDFLNGAGGENELIGGADNDTYRLAPNANGSTNTIVDAGAGNSVLVSSMSIRYVTLTTDAMGADLGINAASVAGGGGVKGAIGNLDGHFSVGTVAGTLRVPTGLATKEINLEAIKAEDLLNINGDPVQLDAAHVFTATAGGIMVNGSGDKLQGDYLFGTDNNNTLTGGLGNDILKGRGGDDTYVWNINDGEDSIIDSAGLDDAVFFGLGITEDMVEYISGGVKITTAAHEGLGEYQQFFTSGIERFDGASYQNVDFTEAFTNTTTNDIYGTEEFNSQTQQMEDVADTLTGTTANDYINGLGNDDVIDGGEGDDVITGGMGSDTLSGGANNDIIIGGDNLTNDIDVSASGGAGADIISGAIALVHGNEGNDLIYDYYGSEVYGDEGDDHIIASFGYSDIHGGTGRDKIEVSSEGNEIWGGDGNDVISVYDTDNIIDGGMDNDVISVFTGGSLASGSTVKGGEGNDVIHLGKNHNVVIVGQGDDVIHNAGVCTIELPQGMGAINSFTALRLGNSNDVKISFSGGSVTLANYYEHPENWYIREQGGASQLVSTLTQQFQNLGQNDTTDMYFYVGSDVSSFALIETSAGNDTIVGNTADNTIRSGSGQDLVKAGDGNDTVYGGDGIDEINGEDGNDTIYGEGGEDILRGGVGNNTVYGGNNNDYITAGTGNDTLYGDEGDDFIDAGHGDNVVQGGFGHDVIHTGGGTDTVHAGDGNDTIEAGGDGFDQIFGEAGADTIFANSGDTKTLDGGEGSDSITAFNGTTTILAGEGDDTVYGATGTFVIQAGGGNDNIEITDSDSLTVEGGFGNDTIRGNGTFVSLFGGEGSDTLYGGHVDTVLDGGEGDDTLRSGLGTTRIIAELGNDTVLGTTGIQTLYIGSYSLGNISLSHDGDDLLIVINSSRTVTIEGQFFAGAISSSYVEYLEIGGGQIIDLAAVIPNEVPVANDDGFTITRNQTLSGSVMQNNGYGADSDGDGDPLVAVLDVGSAYGSLNLLPDGDFTYVPYSNFSGTETFSYTITDSFGASATANISITVQATDIYGTEGVDTIEGWTGSDVIFGLGSADTIYGYSSMASGDAADEIHGGDGEDTIFAGDGDDDIFGDEGNDNIFGDAGIDTIDGGLGIDTILGGEGDDIIDGGADWDIIDGDEGNDTITGGEGNDQLGGDQGNDTIDGGEGNDQMGGFEGDDTLIALSGNDIVYGGTGTDDLYVGTVLTESDISFSRATSILNPTSSDLTDLLITITDGRVIRVVNQYAETQGLLAEQTETLHYGSGLTFDLTSLDFNHTPTAAADTFATHGTQTLYGNVLADNGNGADTDEDGDILSVQANTFTTGLGGSVTLLTDGSLIYTAASGFAGLDTFNYTLDDGNGGVTPGSVSVFVADNAANTLNGTSGNDVINGFGGNDNIYANDGNDTVNGGEGDDTLRGLNGNDIINGDEGLDIILGGNGEDVIHGGTEADNIKGGSQSDTLYGDEGDDVVRGDAGKDTLYGGIGADNLNGGAGDDLINGDDGNDSLFGGTGDDTINGGAGSDTIRGEEGEDVLDGGEGDDDVRGGLDDNIVRGGAGNDAVYGGSSGGDTFVGNDELYGDEGNDQLFAGQGNDKLDGGTGDDAMRGAEGSDTYIASAGSDYIYDSTGTADTLLLGDGIDGGDLVFTNGSRDQTDANDLVIGWNAQDSVEIENQNTTSQTNLVEKLQFGDGFQLTLGRYTTWTKGTASGETFSGNASDNTILGFGGTDTLSGNDGHDELHGGDGTDTLNGGNGNDFLHGGRDNDTLNGNSGHDTLYGGLGDDQVVGGSGNDIYVVTAGTDTLTDADGADTLRFAKDVTLEQLAFTNTGTADVTITSGSSGTAVVKNQRGAATGRIETLSFNDGLSLNFGDYTGWLFALAAGGTLSGTALADTVVGGTGADTISGLEGADTLYGGADIDTVEGGDGNDVVHGGSGNDTVKGDAGADTVYGGDGNDTLFGETAIDDITGDADVIKGGLGNDTAYGGAGDDDIFGEDGNDTLYGQGGVDEISGGEGNDTLEGDDGNDTLNGEDGDDTIAGGAGIDTINGGFGADTITGGDDSDIIDGGSGDDTIDGGAAVDTIHGGNGNDVIDGGATNTALGEGDILFGDDGDDTIAGRDGDDTINGGTGADVIQGDAGTDTLYGGLDGDTFMFMAATAFSELDLIKDFVKETAPGDAEDMLDIKDLLIGYSATSSAITNFLMMTTDGGDTLVSVDRDGTGTAYGFAQISRIEAVTGLEDEQALLTNGNIIAS